MKAPAEMFHEMDSLVQGEIMNKKCLSSSKIFLDLDRTSGVVSNLTFI